jgi:hypothetical protein
MAGSGEGRARNNGERTAIGVHPVRGAALESSARLKCKVVSLKVILPFLVVLSSLSVARAYPPTILETIGTWVFYVPS